MEKATICIDNEIQNAIHKYVSNDEQLTHLKFSACT